MKSFSNESLTVGANGNNYNTKNVIMIKRNDEDDEMIMITIIITTIMMI